MSGRHALVTRDGRWALVGGTGDSVRIFELPRAR
jgi:hypothetical protein